MNINRNYIKSDNPKGADTPAPGIMIGKLREIIIYESKAKERVRKIYNLPRGEVLIKNGFVKFIDDSNSLITAETDCVVLIIDISKVSLKCPAPVK